MYAGSLIDLQLVLVFQHADGCFVMLCASQRCLLVSEKFGWRSILGLAIA